MLRTIHSQGSGIGFIRRALLAAALPLICAAAASAATVAVDIDSNGPVDDLVTTDFFFTVGGLGATVTDVNMRLALGHSSVSDVKVTLTAPNAQTVVLFDGDLSKCTCDNFQDTLFDDQAALAITAGSPPFAGTFRPQDTVVVLNDLIVGGVDGVWKLSIEDRQEFDTGFLFAAGDDTGVPGWGIAQGTQLIFTTQSVGGAAVPLPAAVWGGAALLGLLGAMRFARRRRVEA